jgi:predicted glycoside hydrolase/deacetylase ChbG (UPF0249 family)
MLIINADDWGRSKAETDATLACFQQKRVTSVSAMVFMEDSMRAAELARQHNVDAGLHLNLNERYSGPVSSNADAAAHERVMRFMKKTKFAVMLYHPLLRRDFRAVFQSQWDEFVRLFGKEPSHIDGHQHRHLCANMLLDGIMPRGVKVRRNFSFWPGEKSALNRGYRRMVDEWLARRYVLTDYLFNLAECMSPEKLKRLLDLSRSSWVELETHARLEKEFSFLNSKQFQAALETIKIAGYADLPSHGGPKNL